jgi:hypothetical protein
MTGLFGDKMSSDHHQRRGDGAGTGSTVFAWPVSAPDLSRQTIEPRRSRHLPWPGNLFGEPESIEELMAETRHNVTRMLWNSCHFDIIWFRPGPEVSLHK